MNSRFVYALAGVCCAILIFVFMVLPRLDVVQASGMSSLQYTEIENSGCFSPCNTYSSCGGECDSEQADCCSAGAGVGGSCLYCEEVVVE